MAKKSLIARQKKLARFVARYAAKRAQLKKDKDYEGLQKLPRFASPTRLRNLCMVTGRPRGYMRKFGVSRIVFRHEAALGKIPGIRKSSW